MSNDASLTSRTVRAAKWNYLGNGTRVLLQFCIGIILARLLGPEAFGIVAIAWLIIGIGKLFADFGFSAALIQRRELTDRDVGFVFTVQILIGGLLTVAVFLSADLIAQFFNRPDAADVVRAMSVLFLIQAIGQTTTAALNRSLRFKFTQVSNVASYLVGYVLVGVPAAYLGFGVWSLVAAQLVQAICYATALLFFSNVLIRPAIKPSKPGLFKFGSKVIGANTCSWAISNLDSVLIGRLLGVFELGLYNRAMALVATPMNAITTSLQGVLFSACAKTQHDLPKVALAYSAATQLLAYICFPVFITIAVIPEAVTIGLYGEKWTAAIPLIVPLALAMPVNALLAVVGPVLMALDKTEIELKAQLASVLVMLPVLTVAAQYSITVVAWSILTIYIFRWFVLVAGIRKALDTRWAALLHVLLLPTIVAILIATTIFSLDHFLTLQSPLWRLAVLILASAATLAVVMRLFGPRLLKGPIGLVLEERVRLPQPAIWWLRA